MARKEPYKQSDGRTLVRFWFTSLRSGASHLGCKAALNASNVKDNSLQKELYKALRNGHEDIVELLLSKGANVNQKASRTIGMYREVYSPLGIAIKKGNLPIVQILLKYSANPNIQCWSNDYPLAFALSFGHTEIAKLLLEHGANINQGAFLGQTPLHYFKAQWEPH